MEWVGPRRPAGNGAAVADTISFAASLETKDGTVGKDILSQSEVESLLGSLDLGDLNESSGNVVAARDPGVPVPNVAPPASSPFAIREKVVAYDFKRPERVGKEQMRALQSMHEGFGRNFGASLSALLRSVIEVKLTSVDQLTYSEFVFSLENPSCFNLLKAEPLEGSFILDISPSILYPVIDRLLGGGKEVSPPSRRPLTEIELRLVRRITDLFLEELKHAWANVIDLELSVDRVESNPQLVQVIPPNEVVVIISFEVSLGEVRGMINFCVPFNSIERISSKLTANSWFSFQKRMPSDDSKNQITHQLSGATVEMIVELAQSTIRTSDLIGLRVGDIITTDQDSDGLLPVTVEGIRKFFARPGAVKGRKAFEIDTVVERHGDPLPSSETASEPPDNVAPQSQAKKLAPAGS